jgi:hypothetical protein
LGIDVDTRLDRRQQGEGQPLERAAIGACRSSPPWPHASPFQIMRGNEVLTLSAPPFRPSEASKMQAFRITLSDGARKFHTQLHALDARSAEMKAGYWFDTSKWKILSITQVGAVAA